MLRNSRGYYTHFTGVQNRMSAFETKSNEANTGSSFNKAEFSPLVHNVVHSRVLWILIFTVLFCSHRTFRTSHSMSDLQATVCSFLFLWVRSKCKKILTVLCLMQHVRFHSDGATFYQNTSSLMKNKSPCKHWNQNLENMHLSCPFYLLFTFGLKASGMHYASLKSHSSSSLAHQFFNNFVSGLDLI